MWLPFSLDLPKEVLLWYSLTLITATLLWLIVADYRRARAARHRTHEWILLGFILMINAAIASVIIYYRRELVSFLTSARATVSEPTVLVTLLITISYLIYAIYKRAPHSRDRRLCSAISDAGQVVEDDFRVDEIEFK